MNQKRIAAAVGRILASAAAASFAMPVLAQDPNGQGALKYLADETSKWSALIKALNIKLE